MKLLFYLSIFGIDVAIGAAASYLFASKIVSNKPNLLELIIIFLTIIFLYNLDHYFDTNSITKNNKSTRRTYHLKFKKELLLISILSGIIAAIIAIIFLDAELIIMGIILASSILVYYLILHYTKVTLPKELIAALGYSFGIWLPFLVGLNTYSLLIFLLFTAVNLQNLISYSIIDFEEDKSNYLESSLNTDKRLLNIIIVANSIVYIVIASILIWEFSSLEVVIIITLVFLLQLILSKLVDKNSLISRSIGEYSYLFFLLIYLM